MPDKTKPIELSGNPHVHKIATASLAGVIVGCLLSAIMVVFMTLLAWRICRRKRNKASTYEQIMTDHRNQQVANENGGIIATAVSMKQIPFTVPTQGPGQNSRRGDVRLQEEAAFGGGSEPTSPTGKRPSVEIPGAYALGSIDPSLYKIADEDDDYDVPRDHIGRIWFAVEYERETEKLLVTLIKAKNLPSRVLGNDNGCDPFVSYITACQLDVGGNPELMLVFDVFHFAETDDHGLYLMPDERRYLQSKFRKKTCNPKFEESYVFQVNSRTIDDRVLKLTVYDVDRHKRHNVIGHALYPLRDHDCLLEGRLVVWRDLEREVSETTSDRGEILVSLSYNNHLERLTVSVFEGKTFKRVDGVTTVDSYAKVSLMIQNKMVKSKKTEVVKKSTSPTYNESFTFKLPVTSLDTASITLTAMQYYSGHKDKAIGRVVLGSFMFARGKELDHWNEMVANQKEQVSHWHVLS